MKEQGMLVIISGFSGVGKGTVIKELMRRYDEYFFSVSATTRSPREGEVHGREYLFLNEEEFQQLIEENRLLEYAGYTGCHYGTPADPVKREREAGRHVLLDIEIQGAFQVKKACPEALMLFLLPPSAEVLYRRLVNRGTETMEKIHKRMARSAEEAAYIDRYDGILVNENLDVCVEQLHQIIHNPELAAKYKKENRMAAGTLQKEIEKLLEEKGE
ncbi:guanylate kinase [Hominifimenecus sp. rT4P-3]|uniref:guanylate kinase n=1 Tax=Hominifimenecus sp. rT4P-3 TaxID=3242979 RepID=UPI003DA414F0